MENRSTKEESLYYIITGCRRELPENIAYFHASYRQEHPVRTGRSYTIIDGIEGKGQFLGVTLAAGSWLFFAIRSAASVKVSRR